MTPMALAEAVTRHDPLRRRRLHELRRAGYSPTDALILSRREDVDLRTAVRLLERGCPPATAVRILL